MDDISEESEGMEEGEEEEEVLDPDNPDHAFILLERDFEKTIVEIEQNPYAAQFADDYNKLFERLYLTHNMKKDLEAKFEEMKEEVAMKNDQIELAERIAKADADTIEHLKKQIDYSWKMTDAAHAREQAAQEIIDNLRKQISALTAELDIKNKMSTENGDDAEQMSKTTEGLEREREKLIGEVAQLTLKLTNALGYQEELERKNSAADFRIGEAETQIEEQNAELDKQKKVRDGLENEINELLDTIQKRENEITSLNGDISTNHKAIAKLEDMLRHHKLVNEKASRDNENLLLKYTKLLEDHEKLTDTYESTKKELHDKSFAFKTMEEESTRLRNEIKKLTKNRELMEKRMQILGNEKADIVTEREKLRQIVANMEREVEISKKQADVDKRALEAMNREKEILNRNILRQQAVSKDHVKLIKIQEQSKKKLEAECEEFRIEVNKQKKHISYLEKERDRLSEEELDLTAKIENILDEIKMKKAEIFELKKTLAENENKLRMQQNLFEVVRAERNNFQKGLQQATAEVSELKTKLKINSHQSEQLKEDISMKEQLLIKEENILRKINKEKENLKVEVQNGLDHIKALKDEIAEMSAEEKRLHKVILNGDRLIRQQAKDLDQLMNERDILGSQLVRRNDELSLLYEKIRILQSTLHRGEAQYDQRLEDIRLLKVEIRRLRQEKKLLSKSISNMTDLRQEIFHLERDLTKERLKCRALEEELQNPLNVHRWRKLEGSDPDVLELLQKVTLLQKRLLRQSSEAIERERQLKEVENLYKSLKQVVANTPGPEMKNELTKTQKALTVYTNKMKCLVSELNMTELQASEYKFNLDKMTEELAKLKKDNLLLKKVSPIRQVAPANANLKSAQLTSQAQTKTNASTLVKFTGGGFKMSVPS